jgi:hypothetical protein
LAGDEVPDDGVANGLGEVSREKGAAVVKARRPADSRHRDHRKLVTPETRRDIVLARRRARYDWLGGNRTVVLLQRREQRTGSDPRGERRRGRRNPECMGKVLKTSLAKSQPGHCN